MPRYRLHIENSSQEDHVLDLPSDELAISEAVRTAAGLVNDITPAHAGPETQWVEVSTESGASLMRIEIRAIHSK
jgi:hypothetical protein